MQNLLFALALYAQLAAFLIACWGWGWAVLPLRQPKQPVDTPLALAVGMGIVICSLQAWAVAGWLSPATVLGTVGAGLCLSMVAALRSRLTTKSPNTCRLEQDLISRTAHWLFPALVMVYALPLAVVPLGPPLAWDELMYHLPHAREWALSGTLQVNEWLRYPWFPYNFDLLYAAALTLGNDVLPHLLHAAAGGITAWLIYRLGLHHLQDPAASALAALVWIFLTRPLYSSAYVDMGVAMFTLAACAAMQEWLSSGENVASRERRWAFACAFLLGVAAGAKYQVLMLLPFFALVLAWHDRRPSTWIGAAFFLCLPCLYWYARNAVMTGDPFNPMGGRLFGFSDWNLRDYQWQFEDLRRNVGWPHWTLWPALTVLLWPALRNQRTVRRACLAATYMVAVWALSSRYPRYLMPAFPVLALLAAASCLQALRRGQQWLGINHQWSERGVLLLGVLLLASLALPSWREARNHWRDMTPTQAARDAVLAKRLDGYGMWTYLQAHPQTKIYQVGLEDNIYYAPRPIWGEVFGPWRYTDYIGLPAEAMFRKLSEQGFTALVIHTGRAPMVDVQRNFECYFQLVHRDGSVALYALRTATCATARSTPSANPLP